MAAVKFDGVDVLDFLGKVVELHTQHYKDDFDIDKELIQNLAACRNEENEQLLWMSRTCGTYCLWERDVYLQDSHENKVWRFYHEQTKDSILAYAIQLDGIQDGKVTGCIWPLDYHAHVERVKLLSCAIEKYQYCSRMAHRRYSPMIPICSRLTCLRPSMELPNA